MTGTGWYFYGITRRASAAALLAAADGGHEVASRTAAAPLQLLELSELAAVVRPVRLADFTPAALQERIQNASALEEMVRSHNRVIEAISARQAILPAKFGTVYANAEDVLSAMRPEHDTLLLQLLRLEGCDEWAVHLYANRAAIRGWVSTTDLEVQRMRETRAAARPGRAYFLDQQIRNEVEAATEYALSTLAQSAFDRLASYAVAGQVNPVAPAADPAGEVEILRASFLVSRDGAERFKQEVCSSADSGDALRCEYSGPWPPYSFAVRDAEEAQ